MTVRTRNRLITFSILAGPFIFLFCLLLFWDAEPLPPAPALPNPNGYDALVKAEQMLSADTSDYYETNVDQVRKVALADGAALSLARAGLSNQCRVPLQFTVSYISNHLSDLAGLKRLAQALIAEGRLAEVENRPGDAAKSYLDTIHLANASSHGGVLIDELVGMAIEAMGTSHLQALIPRLDAKSSRYAAAALEVLDSQKQTWNEVMQQERDWSRRTFRGTRYELVRFMSRKTLNQAYQMAELKFEEQQSKTRRLIIELAARAYQLDKGHPPASLTDLVPDYLKAIPQDPLTGTNMVYTP
jgi:hypothetical protein